MFLLCSVVLEQIGQRGRGWAHMLMSESAETCQQRNVHSLR